MRGRRAAPGRVVTTTRSDREAARHTVPVSPSALYDRALVQGGAAPLALRAGGESRPLPLGRWCGPPDRDDVAVLDRFTDGLVGGSRVLDLGCGPGRHVEHLHRTGFDVLGVDTSAVAVRLTRDRGVPATCTDALGPLPRSDRAWDGVVLLDGNVGIGGDPLLLLCRVRDLLAPGSRVLVELGPLGADDRFAATLDDGTCVSAPFPWARLGRGPGLEAVACRADLRPVDAWDRGGTSFAVLAAGGRA